MVPKIRQLERLRYLVPLEENTWLESAVGAARTARDRTSLIDKIRSSVSIFIQRMKPPSLLHGEISMVEGFEMLFYQRFDKLSVP